MTAKSHRNQQSLTPGIVVHVYVSLIDHLGFLVQQSRVAAADGHAQARRMGRD